ncbi:MAG: hypothetical protein HYY24_02905 [Verrucomicrobia bacterium]|nr:hypothetical protein [Verrucomicrobiota bacterium]
MKTRLNQVAGSRASRAGVPIATTLLLLAALPVTAQTTTSYTATGWVIGVPVPGIWFTNALGQVGIRGNAHLARVESSDPRLTGRRTIFVDAAAQADGSAILYGPAYHEVGTWDGTGTNFTATGGMWETSYRGTMGADGSLNLHIVGTGWGGTIDGLRLDETLTRAAGAILDPAIPYQYGGTIKPPPLNTNLVIDDFTGPTISGNCYKDWLCYGPNTRTYTRTDGQLVVTGHWPGVITRNVPDPYTFGGTYAWTVADGQTLEARVDLVELGASATAARLVLGTESGFYSVFKGHDFVALSKWSANLPNGPVIMFFYEKAQVPDTNVVLSLALTKAAANIVVAARLWDKANPDTVLYERSVVDTPGSDPALTSAELQTLSGMNLTLSPDTTEAPFTGGGALIGVFQYNSDGLQPAAVATFDNFEIGKYEVPSVGIARAVRLTWPDLGSYAVESAPTVNGPWLPVQDLEVPGMKQMVVRASSPAHFFRLRQAP